MPGRTLKRAASLAFGPLAGGVEGVEGRCERCLQAQRKTRPGMSGTNRAPWMTPTAREESGTKNTETNHGQRLAPAPADIDTDGEIMQN